MPFFLIILAVLAFLIVLFLVSYIFFSFMPWKIPRLTESDLTTFRFPFDYLYYASKYLMPIKRATKGSGFKQYFSENKAPILREKLNNSKEVSINAVGDLMIRTEISRGDKTTLWEDIGSELFASDITFGNFELCVNENWLIDKTIRYSMSHEQADVLIKDPRYGKFDVLSIANNHINDSLSEGIVTTQEYLDKNGIIHFGANSSLDVVNNIPIEEKNGVKIAFIGYTFSTNGIPLKEDFKFGTNVVRFNALNPDDYDPSLIVEHIKIAKEKGADIIVASLHWGVEFEYYPPVRIVERGHEILDAGVDIIIGHHPHILNPSQWYRTRDGRDTVCFYSLGSIITVAMPWVPQNLSQMVGITLESGESESNKRIVRIKDVEIMPTFFVKKGRGRTSKHRIYPLFKTYEKIINGEKPNNISFIQRFRLKLAYREFKKHFIQQAFDYK